MNPKIQDDAVATARQRSAIFRRAASGIIDLLCPRICHVCDHPLAGDETDLCGACAVKLARDVSGDYCHSCGEDRGPHLLIEGRCTDCRLNEKPKFEAFVRVGRYGPALSALILRFKRDFTLDFLLGNLLVAAIGPRREFASIDCWVPIPTHWRARWRRGFQPTALLAQAIARRAAAGHCVHALSTTRFVTPFHTRKGMSAAARAQAIRGAFAVKQPLLVEGRSICLIDDVTTTGATLSEARRVLRQAGAKSVSVAVIAKTSRTDPGVDPDMAQS